MTNFTIYGEDKTPDYETGLSKESQAVYYTAPIPPQTRSCAISYELHGDSKKEVISGREYTIYKNDDDCALEERVVCYQNKPCMPAMYRTVATGSLPFIATEYKKLTGFPPIITDSTWQSTTTYGCTRLEKFYGEYHDKDMSDILLFISINQWPIITIREAHDPIRKWFIPIYISDLNRGGSSMLS
jgi:hypothetical protein